MITFVVDLSNKAETLPDFLNRVEFDEKLRCLLNQEIAKDEHDE